GGVRLLSDRPGERVGAPVSHRLRRAWQRRPAETRTLGQPFRHRKGSGCTAVIRRSRRMRSAFPEKPAHTRQLGADAPISSKTVARSRRCVRCVRSPANAQATDGTAANMTPTIASYAPMRAFGDVSRTSRETPPSLDRLPGSSQNRLKIDVPSTHGDFRRG